MLTFLDIIHSFAQYFNYNSNRFSIIDNYFNIININEFLSSYV